MIAKKPKYIRKYDYIHYFTRPRDQWFYSDSDLEKFIEVKTNELSRDEWEDEDQQDDFEFDTLENLRQLVASGETLDLTNPKIVEGNIIDQESRKFIKMKFHLNAYDFDELYPKNYDFNFLYQETLKFLEKDNFILFQPVFIYKNKAITRPDALIKKGGKYTLVEAKGTSKPRASHLVDIIYQQHIINDVLSNSHKSIDEYMLCVIKYVKGEKNKLDFALTTHIPLNKGGKDLAGLDKLPWAEKYSEVTIQRRCEKRLGDDSDPTIDQLIHSDTSLINSRNLNDYHDYVIPLLQEKNFDKVINELHEYTPYGYPSLEPDAKHFITWFGKYSQLSILRKYYFYHPAYWSLKWSGKILNLKNQLSAHVHGQDNNIQAIKKFMLDNGKVDNLRFFNDFNNTLYTQFDIGVYRTKETKEGWSKLKTKKVYFDFESINPAIRVMDDTVPYTQTVTQVSVIKNNEAAINLVFDPLHINKEDFKKIIDSIYADKDYSYIVYNKSFECARLREMAMYLHNEQYLEKVRVIIENIFDMADFFNPQKNLITVRNLYGRYSIKNVLPLVEKYEHDIFESTGCKNYKNLEGVHNGGEALNQTSRRFFKLIDDNQWGQIVTQLKVYCENDVRAMMAIEGWVNRVLKK